MAIQRRASEIHAELPTSVYAVDLGRLSQLLRIPESELVSGFQARPHVSEMHGRVVNTGEDVAFEAVGHVDEQSALRMLRTESPRGGIPVPTPPQSSHRQQVRQVLLTAASRPTSLDSDELPKCLIPIGSQTVVTHILTQLYAAGIERVVISVAAGGDKIKTAVKQSPFYAKMVIEFHDLGENNRDGHARSILAARRFFPKGPFLIHTADHIFDKSIISKFTSLSLGDNEACVLVETNATDLVGLPMTAVRVQLKDSRVARISRELAQFDGIDAGLFLSNISLFDVLHDLALTKDYFPLAEALNKLARARKLSYVPTDGETWFSIETEEQLAITKYTDGISTLSPWTVLLASSTPAVDTPHSSKSMVIGISGAEQHASLRVAGHPDASSSIDGFVIGVQNAEYRENQHVDPEEFPMLSVGRRSFLGSSRSRRSMGGSFIDSARDQSFLLSIPVDATTTQDVDVTPSSHHAYLIEMANDPTTPVAAGSQFVLAVPNYGETPPSSTLSTRSRRRELLPSDIKDISLETRGYDDTLEVTVVVQRQVPLIGYVLLISSLVTLSSVGVALAMEDNVVTPLIKLFWRQTATCMTMTPLAIMSIRRNGPPPFHDLRHLATMVITGASYAFYLGSFVISLSMTSVGHATLFNNSHSLLIVFIKFLFGQPVEMFEGLGAAVGVLGGGITSTDATKAHDSAIVSPSALGDLVALAGALGGASYFINAKKLRPLMEMPVFMACLTFTSEWMLLGTLLVSGVEVTLSMDPHHGLFGWMNPTSDRLLVQLYLVFVCDMIGTMGYISVLKYFDPVVVSVACLLEPLIANLMGIVCGVDVMPGWVTFVGATLVTVGTIMVIGTQSQKIEEIDATDALVASAVGTPTPRATPKALYSARTHRKRMGYGTA
ncbi:TPA: hypothetical protein N0F65_004568 [Lagenidium giganteum]|uniref:Drug/Metabolite Transporter (DMT) Superfamily n=1 Tax=Lagenidium giganteum TaxID=4803 RepID=A0AAV2ZAC1_9STRA|nr:TPA: hypothetical protein N0F65_004568 [Lagenidium giganteum]